MPIEKLKNYLDDNNIKYVRLSHSPAYTAQEVAALAHIPGRELAKSVIVNLDGNDTIVVLPASCRLDLDRLKEVTGAKEAMLATESDFQKEFPDCEVGAMPPFGNLYGLDMIVAEQLAEDETIAFKAGTHHELIQMSYDDYARLVQPKVARIAKGAVAA